jgi:hypothetical protein
MKTYESRKVTIIIGELGFSSDLGFQKTVEEWIGSSINTPPSSKNQRERAGTLDPRYT